MNNKKLLIAILFFAIAIVAACFMFAQSKEKPKAENTEKNCNYFYESAKAHGKLDADGCYGSMSDPICGRSCELISEIKPEKPKELKYLPPCDCKNNGEMQSIDCYTYQCMRYNKVWQWMLLDEKFVNGVAKWKWVKVKPEKPKAEYVYSSPEIKELGDAIEKKFADLENTIIAQQKKKSSCEQKLKASYDLAHKINSCMLKLNMPKFKIDTCELVKEVK